MKKIASAAIVFMVAAVSLCIIFNMDFSEVDFSDGFTKQIEKSVADAVPMKEKLSEFMTRIRFISGVRYLDDIYIGDDGSLLRDVQEPNSRTVSTARNYILSFAENNDCDTYFMLIPTSSVIKQQEITAYASENLFNQHHLINEMYSELYGKLNTVEVYQSLFSHRNEYIYYHTESFPTGLGGYYIYRELAGRMNLKAKTLGEFSAAYAAHNFYGSLASEKLRPYASPDFVSLYEYSEQKINYTVNYYSGGEKIESRDGLHIYDENKVKDKTDMILGNFYPLCEIESDIEERNSLLVFADSTVKSWIPFITPHYNKIMIVNLDELSDEDVALINVKSYDKVLFAYGVDSFTSGIDFKRIGDIGA